MLQARSLQVSGIEHNAKDETLGVHALVERIGAFCSYSPLRLDEWTAGQEFPVGVDNVVASLEPDGKQLPCFIRM